MVNDVADQARLCYCSGDLTSHGLGSFWLPPNDAVFHRLLDLVDMTPERVEVTIAPGDEALAGC